MGHPERKRWKPWLDAQVKWVEIGRAHPLLVCNPQDMLIPWIGDVAAAPILADMAMAVVERGKDPRAAAKEASDKISRDIIGKAKRERSCRGARVLPSGPRAASMTVQAKPSSWPGAHARHRRQALIGMGLLLPSAALVLAFTLFPVGYNVWLGFYAKHSLRATSTWVGLGNYTQILADPDFWRSVWLATEYAVLSTALQIVAGVAGALILHRRFPGCDFLRGVALFPYMIPTVIAVFVWRWLMNDLYGVIPYVLGALAHPGDAGGVARPTARSCGC